MTDRLLAAAVAVALLLWRALGRLFPYHPPEDPQ